MNTDNFKKTKLTLPSLILKKRQINFDNDKKFPEINNPLSKKHLIINSQFQQVSNMQQIQSGIAQQQQQHQQKQNPNLRINTANIGQYSGNIVTNSQQNNQNSRNIMSEELLRKSSMFRRDMRKLNIMKEVKDLLENKQRMDLFSPQRQRPNIIPASGLQNAMIIENRSLDESQKQCDIVNESKSYLDLNQNTIVSNNNYQMSSVVNTASQTGYKFPYHRRSSCGDDQVQHQNFGVNFPQSQPTSPNRQSSTFKLKHQFEFRSPRQSFSKLGNNFLSDPNDAYNMQQYNQNSLNNSGSNQNPFGQSLGHGKMQPFKVNDYQIFHDQFIKIVENSYILNDSQNNSLMQKDTALAGTNEDPATHESKFYTLLNQDIFEQTFEELLQVQDKEDENLLKEMVVNQEEDDEEDSPNNVDGWFLTTLVEAVKQNQPELNQCTTDPQRDHIQILEPELNQVLDQCKYDQEIEIQQTLSEIIKLIKSKSLIREKTTNAQNFNNTQDQIHSKNKSVKHQNDKSKDVINEMENFFKEMGDNQNSRHDKKVISNTQILSKNSFQRASTQLLNKIQK
eukprot:403338361